MIYRHRTTLSVVGGSQNTVTLNVHDGIARQLLVRALTSQATLFDANIVDDGSLRIYDHGFEEGELNERALDLPVSGTLTVNVTNASLTETFNVLLAVEEV